MVSGGFLATAPTNPDHSDMLRSLLLVPLALVFLASSPEVSAQIHVDASVLSSGDGTSWGTAYKTLTEALAVAAAGDEIRVAEGTYTPSSTGDRSASFDVPAGVDTEADLETVRAWFARMGEHL